MLSTRSHRAQHSASSKKNSALKLLSNTFRTEIGIPHTERSPRKYTAFRTTDAPNSLCDAFHLICLQHVTGRELLKGRLNVSMPIEEKVTPHVGAERLIGLNLQRHWGTPKQVAGGVTGGKEDCVEEGSQAQFTSSATVFNLQNQQPNANVSAYSTVTDFAKFRGWSTSVPLSTAT